MPGGRSMVTMGMPGVTNTSQPSAGFGFTLAFAVFAGLGPICDIFDLLHDVQDGDAYGRRPEKHLFSSSSSWRLRRFPWRSCLKGLRGGTDDVEHPFWLGEHWHVAALQLIGGCVHALGEKTLEIGMHGAVFFADNVPARLRLPGGPPDFRVEQVGFRDALGRPNELLLLLRKVSTEILRAVRTQPDTSIHDFDVGEDVGLREVGLLRLRRFIGVWSERADVNQPDNTIVGSGTGDDASAVGVADEDNGAADPAQCCFHQGHILCRCVKAVLRRNTLIALRLKGNDQLAKARAIGPESVAKHDAWFSLRGFRIHCVLLSPYACR